MAAALALLLSTTTAAVQARDLCATVTYLIDQSETRFADVPDMSHGNSGGRAVISALADASSCRATKSLHKGAYHCVWEFPFRAKPAYDRFDAFVRQLNGCLGGGAAPQADQSVNHPDFYDLRRYEVPQAAVSVSIKDKSALGKTFVFIRVSGATQ